MPNWEFAPGRTGMEGSPGSFFRIAHEFSAHGCAGDELPTIRTLRQMGNDFFLFLRGQTVLQKGRQIFVGNMSPSFTARALRHLCISMRNWTKNCFLAAELERRFPFT